MSVASRSDLSGKRVLITGASGFTGRYVGRELLSHGCHVTGLGGGADTAQTGSDMSAYVQADLRDADSLARAIAESRPDIVLHLAAIAFVGHGSADDFYNVNLVGSRNLLQAVASQAPGVERVLLASSANVYGNLSSGKLDEKSIPAPANDYAVSKLAMEYMASLWRDKLPITVTRPFNYTGAGQSENFLIPKIVSHFAHRKSEIELGNLDVSRDFSDVRTVALAYRLLLQTPAAIGQTVNVCSGTGNSLGQIIDICSRLTGHSIEVRVNPAFVRASEVKVLLGDNGLLHELIGEWQAPTLEQTISWMLAEA
ncbi:MAG TPA: GDP-mannose 4,6 dehydratase [Stenotrophomonas sp.]|nr:GDP-mannose 4,6 dehydratase [Stenotrophomonas sp.]